MASLPKRSAPQQSNSRETEWIDVSADEYLRHEKGENSRRIHLCVPDGKADASGIHVFRNHPEFYLPWTCISNLPG
jgi:hypothetical protein